MVSYPRLSRITRRNGTLYLRFFGLDDLEVFFVLLTAFVDRPAPVLLRDFVDLPALARLTAFVDLPAFARLATVVPLVGGGRFLPTALRPELERAEGSFGRLVALDAAVARASPTSDRWTSVNRTWSPSQLYAQISATESCSPTQRRFAVSTLETGT